MEYFMQMLANCFSGVNSLLIGLTNYQFYKEYSNNLVSLLLNTDHNVMVVMSLSILLIILLWHLVLRKVRNKDIKMPSLRSISAIVPGDDKPRFRKIDKIRYYVTRFNRKFKDLTKKLQNIKSKDQKQKLMSIFAKKILNLQDNSPKLLKRMLPDAFLEPDTEEDESNLPEEFQLILDSIKVFGHLEKSFLLEICKNIETIKLESGQFLFKKGDIDENIFVVKSGEIKVFIDDGESNVTIHDVQRGGNIHSLLSVLDVITGNIQPYKTVQAIAVIPSQVLRLRTNSFLKMLEQSPQSMVRIIQLIAMRLHRVTFLCLHNYLGLSSELMNKSNLALPDSNVVKMSNRIHTITNNNKIKKRSLAVDTPPPSCLKQNLNTRRKSGHQCNKRSDDIKEASEEGSTAYRRCSHQDHVPIERSTDAVFSFAKRENVEGLESGETPDTNFSNPSVPNLLRSASLLDYKRPERYLKRPRQVSLFSNMTKNEQMSTSDFVPSSNLLTAVKEDIAKLLGLPNIDALSNVTISLVSAGTWLIKEGEEDTDVYFVVSGELHVLQQSVGNDTTKLSSLFIAHPGELCGISAVISTEPNYYSVKVNRTARVVILSRELLYSLIKNDITVLFHLSHLLIQRMSPFLRQIDFALEWTSMKAGYSLYKTGDIAKSVYIILNGRFRQICIKPDGSREIVNELGRGELFGFVEVLSDQPRATTIMAIRDSELAQIPAGLLSWIKRKAPHVVTRLIQLLADKLIVSMIGQSSSIVKNPVGTMANLRTIAVAGSSNDVPLEPFVLELQHSMMNIGLSIRLTSNIIIQRLGTKALDTMNEHRLSSWLSQQEDLNRLVFYVCDSYPNSPWTRRCIRQADCVLVVALANKEPRLGPMEQAIQSDQTKVTKILVLLYPNEKDFPPIGKTSEWLNSRPWVTQHYHIRCPKRMFIRRNKERLVSFYKRIFEKEVANPHADMSRLARYLTGTAIGLVLGGGGARGCSHVGSIRAMQESGIPIDMVGGTSIGAFIGALWAEETRITQFTQRARSFSKEMSSVWKLIFDLTYSPVSMFSGRAMNSVLEKVFKDRQIEDLWIPYFCITTDISNSKMRAHTNGSLWRFVRASMSLSGYLPPLCHPEDGSLLLDGGYVNNLPADVMLGMGSNMIFAIDVGSQDNTDLTNYGDCLSGLTLLYHKFITRTPMKVLNLTEIQSRLAYVSCVRHMEQVKSSGICEYMRPPIQHYTTLQFGSFDEIQEVGYNYTKERILQWQLDNSLKPFACEQLKWSSVRADFIPKQDSSPVMRSMRMYRSHSRDLKDYVIGSSSLADKQKHFIDLAELVSRIGQEEDDLYDSESEDLCGESFEQIQWDDWNETAEEMLMHAKESTNRKSSFPRNDCTDYVTFSVSSPDDKERNDETHNNGARKCSPPKTNSNSQKRNDENLEDIDIASDPENFHRVLDSSRKRKPRRSSLNRLHKSVTFDRSVNSN